MASIIAIDTNILVRLITQDDKLQYEQSLSLFKNQSIFITDKLLII
jgi:predicted nucleic-acid-binding protein